MRSFQLKQVLRLNRHIGGVCLLLEVLLIAHQIPLSRPIAAVWIAVGLSLLALLVNEAVLRLLCRHADSPLFSGDKLSIVAPLSTWTVTTTFYALTGLGVGAFLMLLPILQSQFVGQKPLTLILLLATGLLWGLSVMWFTPSLPVDPLTGFAGLLLPAAWCLLQFGQGVGATILQNSGQVSRLQSLAATDGLTGLINRRQFNQQLSGEVARARRHQSPLSLALFDIDNFKKLNDFYGHPVGDRILKELGGLLLKSIRESDIAARYGGEEFVLVLPETRQTEALEIMERLRHQVEKHVFCLPDNPITLSISIGIAQLDQPPAVHGGKAQRESLFEFVERADSALYEAKRQGKNRVVLGLLPAGVSKLKPSSL